jgi:hypothetical protein
MWLSPAFIGAPIVGFLLFWRLSYALQRRLGGFAAPSIRLLFGIEGAGVGFLLAYLTHPKGTWAQTRRCVQSAKCCRLLGAVKMARVLVVEEEFQVLVL